jgi:hypothetical protein
LEIGVCVLECLRVFYEACERRASFEEEVALAGRMVVGGKKVVRQLPSTRAKTTVASN